MVTPRVEGANEISINAIRYRLDGPVHRFLASQPTPRMVVGEVSPRASQAKSVLSWTSWRGGGGIERIDPARDGNRYWWSTADTTVDRHLTLGRLATTTAASGVSGSFEVGFINERANVIYAAFGTAVRSYNNTTDSWGSTLATLAANATDSLNIRLGGTEYLIIAMGASGYVYFDGTTWTSDATYNTQYVAFWDNRLWGIGTNGLLWSSGTIGVEETDAQLPLPNDSVTNLFPARAPSGDLILYAATNVGLYAHNSDGMRFERTQPEMPRHPDNGIGSTAWMDSTYLSAGLGVYKVINGENNAVVTIMGLDRDHGLPTAYRGRIRALVPSLNDLIAILDAATSAVALTVFPGGGLTDANVTGPDTGRSAVMAWNERGWHALWTSADTTLPITAAHVSYAYNSYRLWWAHNLRVLWMTIPKDITNPAQLTDRTYAASSSHETGWFDADETHGDKVGVVVCVDTTGMSANETIRIRYRLNYDDTTANQTSLGAAAITTSGHTEYLLPNATTPEGVLWRQIKFVADLVRGTTTTNSPDLNRLDFYFLSKEETRWGASCIIWIPTSGDFGQSAELMYENILAATALALQVQVTWRSRDADDAGTANPYNYYMDIVQFTGEENTGHDFGAKFRLTMIQR